MSAFSGRALLRWSGVVAFGLVSLLGLAVAPASGGLSLALGIPAGWVAAWLVGNDPSDRPDASLSAFVALTIGVLFVGWIFVCLVRDTTIFGY